MRGTDTAVDKFSGLDLHVASYGNHFEISLRFLNDAQIYEALPDLQYLIRPKGIQQQRGSVY